MINFKNVAEMCLNGNLSGTFVTKDGKKLHSKLLRRSELSNDKYPYWFNVYPCTYQTLEYSYMPGGESAIVHAMDIVDFIPEVEVKQHKYVYEFSESPAKLLHSDDINRFATKIIVDDKIIKNRYGKSGCTVLEEKLESLKENVKNYGGIPMAIIL